MTQTLGFRLFQIARSDMEGVTEIILVTEQRTPGIKVEPSALVSHQIGGSRRRVDISAIGFRRYGMTLLASSLMKLVVC